MMSSKMSLRPQAEKRAGHGRKEFCFHRSGLVKRATAERDGCRAVVVRLGEREEAALPLLKEDAVTGSEQDRDAERRAAIDAGRNSPLQSSLFEQVAEDCVDDDERSVAWNFEKQGPMLWLYRSVPEGLPE